MTADSSDYARLDHPEITNALFHPRRSTNSEPVPGAVDLDFEVTPGIRLGARFHGGDPENPNILFFHGNGEIVDDYDLIGPMYNHLGLNLLVVDYRGYGRSDGNPMSSTMLSDAHSVLAEAKKWLATHNYPGPLFIMGRSLGSAAALELGHLHGDEIAGIIIESGFATTMPLLITLGVDVTGLELTEDHGFRNVRKIEKITKPTLIIHARNDQLLPLSNAGLLHGQCGARNKEYQVVPGADHNTIIQVAGRLYFDVIKSFINKTRGFKPGGRRKKQRERTIL